MEWLIDAITGEGFVPRIKCGNWTDVHLYLSIIANSVIALMYLFVAIVLCGLFAYRNRHRVLAGQGHLLLLYSLVFSTCGIGHLLGGVIVFAIGFYWVISIWDTLTAIVAIIAFPTFGVAAYFHLAEVNRVAERYDRLRHNVDSAKIKLKLAQTVEEIEDVRRALEEAAGD